MKSAGRDWKRHGVPFRLSTHHGENTGAGRPRVGHNGGGGDGGGASRQRAKVAGGRVG